MTLLFAGINRRCTGRHCGVFVLGGCCYRLMRKISRLIPQERAGVIRGFTITLLPIPGCREKVTVISAFETGAVRSGRRRGRHFQRLLSLAKYSDVGCWLRRSGFTPDIPGKPVGDKPRPTGGARHPIPRSSVMRKRDQRIDLGGAFPGDVRGGVGGFGHDSRCR
jgi:hypothetical protein